MQQVQDFRFSINHLASLIREWVATIRQEVEVVVQVVAVAERRHIEVQVVEDIVERAENFNTGEERWRI